HHSRGGGAGGRRRTGARRPHRMGAAHPALADGGCARPSPLPLPPPETLRTTEPLKDMSRLRARRRQARRRRHLARLDFGLGLLLAVVALLVAPGIAIVAL